MQYIQPVFRPPSEARSHILQVTNGCSWNRCTFCEMYTETQKRFSVKATAQLEQELLQQVRIAPATRRFFLADGDAMTLSFRRLREILVAIAQHFPLRERVTAYCLPRNLRNKSIEELTALRLLGLSMVYVGCESGDDQVLEFVGKGETFASSKEALLKLKAAGIQTSVMILNGLGGQHYSHQHAMHSAQLMNETQPDYLSTLVVSFPTGDARFRAGFQGTFEPLSQQGLFRELKRLIEQLELDHTVFRSDHASNYLILKGTLAQDKADILQKLEAALQHPGSIPLRQEWQRGL